MSQKSLCIVIMGPTASGKTALAFELAKEISGTVINGDSMQLYQDLRILTARPTAEELQEFKGVPYKLDGILPVSEKANVAKWLDLAAEAIRQAWREGRIPIVVGGTGMYLQALMEGISPIPEIPAEIRNTVRKLAEMHSVQELQDLLKENDPAAKLYQDPKRLSRALEVILATGKPITYFQNNKKPVIEAEFLRIGLLPEREELYQRIDTRLEGMRQRGALAEVEVLKQHNLPKDHPLSGAVGVQPFSDYLEGKCSLDEALSQAKRQTRNFAKRQMTWMRGQMNFDLTFDSYKLTIQEMIKVIKQSMPHLPQ